jgi:hypothetical protein
MQTTKPDVFPGNPLFGGSGEGPPRGGAGTWDLSPAPDWDPRWAAGSTKLAPGVGLSLFSSVSIQAREPAAYPIFVESVLRKIRRRHYTKLGSAVLSYRCRYGDEPIRQSRFLLAFQTQGG